MELLYMLAGGALVLAGLFVGVKLNARVTQGKEQPETQEVIPQILSEEDILRAQKLRDQWDNVMNYDGRDQKAGK